MFSYYGDSLFLIYPTKRVILSFKTQYLWPILIASVTQIDVIEPIKAKVTRFCQRLGRYPSSFSWSLARGCYLSIASSRRIGTRAIKGSTSIHKCITPYHTNPQVTTSSSRNIMVHWQRSCLGNDAILLLTEILDGIEYHMTMS
jgi:hypothetical protein